MRKKLCTIFAALMMCLFIASPVYAANGRPNVELMKITYGSGKNGLYSPDIWFRNNSGKTIKYLDWYFTLYNRVNDPTPDEITHNSTVHIQIIGPIEPDEPITTTRPSGFLSYEKDTNRYILYNGNSRNVYIDSYGHYFIYADVYYSGYSHDFEGSSGTEIYLTDEEVASNTFYQYTNVKNAWVSNVFSYARLQKVSVTYMDGTTETIDGSIAEEPWLTATISNGIFKDDVKKYSAIYNYRDYVTYNPDLKDILKSNDEYGYFHHFITTGMAEGRRGIQSFLLPAYKYNNSDLVAIFGDDNVKYYQHYMQSGKTEGRKATW